MKAATQLKPDVRDLLRESAEWRLIGLLFECPSVEWHEQIAALRGEVKDPELQSAAALAAKEADEGVYHSIFGPGGPAPARQASYQDSMELGYLMSELTSYYDAFAYRPKIQEAIDHVAMEAGFVAYLRFKQAYALCHQETEKAEIAAESSARFIADQLSVMAEPICNLLVNSGVGYLAKASQALFVRVGARRKSSMRMDESLLPVLADENVITCGDAPCSEPSDFLA